MDEKLKISSSSCETPRQVSDSSESKPEICEQSEYLATSSESVGENLPITNLESMLNIKGMVKRELCVPPASDNILDDAIKSISSYIQPLYDEQKKCNDRVQISNLNISTSSVAELVDKLKSLTELGKLRNSEININSFLYGIEEALKLIKGKLHLPFLADSSLHEAFTSLNICIRTIAPKQAKHITGLTRVKKSLEKKLPLPTSVDEEVAKEFHSLIHSMEWILAELNRQATVFDNIIVSTNSIKENLSSQEMKFYKIEISRDTDKNPGTH